MPDSDWNGCSWEDALHLSKGDGARTKGEFNLFQMCGPRVSTRKSKACGKQVAVQSGADGRAQEPATNRVLVDTSILWGPFK